MKNSILKRALSLMLCLVLVASYLPAGVLTAVAEGTVALNISKVADPSTKDGWQSYFGTGENISTDNAGGIWTDKSVFTDASAFSNITTDSQGNAASITMKNPNDLLVALSAMASNMTVSGQASVPTDTMLVLDVSGSMNDGNNDVAEELAEAANTTIQELLTSNPSNRVGVVLYSGTSSSSTNNDAAVILLPLGRYTTGSDNEYVSYTSTGWWDTTETISLDSDVRIEGTSTRPSSTSKEVVGATYIQKGIMLAANQLTADSNETTANGVPRKPIMVLMSDGAPTLSTTSFTAPGQYNLGNGQSSSTSAAQGFVTQLSCAYAKAKVEEKYANDALFYTIGLGTTGDQVATSVLDPAHSNSGINEFWRQYNLASVGSTVNVQGSGGNARSVTKIDTALEQNYADKYIGVTADTNLAQGLKDAFAAIVDDIQLQSKYFPTLVGSSHNLSGYVSFSDKIGAYMSVKDVKGILLHDQLFSGHHLAKNFVAGGGILGTEANPKPAGTAMMESVRDRLGLDSNEAAISLISNAHYYGQLSFDPATGAHSNYIGWYADAQGAYMGFYHEGVTQLPANAVYTVKSYGFLGDTDPDHGVSESDMMYATVQVRHNIATGEEEMLLKIPAALIPTITYEVELEADGTLKSLTTSGASYPFRLLYEVGLDPHINSLNVTEHVTNEYLNATGKDGKRFTVNADGSINFYTNKFDAQLETGYGTSNTYSYFNPSHQNDKYYFQDHAMVYADQNGTLYTGATAPSAYSGTLYRQHISYKKVSGQLVTDVHYHALATEGRAAAVQTAGENTWYVPEGTVYTNMEGFTYYKGYTSTYDPAKNLTDTLTYAKQPFVDVYGHSVTETNHNFTIGSTLGNNGKLTITPATGLKLTKEMAEGVTDPGTAFTFTVVHLNSSDSSTYAAVLESADGTQTDTTVTFAAGKATVQLKAGETLYITGLTPDQYQITETETDDYVAVQDTITVTVTDKQIVTADFVNKERGKGNLLITKELEHTQEGHIIPESVLLEWFWVNVDLGMDFAGKDVQVNDGTNTGSWLVGNDGTLQLQVRHGQTIAIQDLPEGTQVTVTELTTNMRPIFEYDHINSRDHSGATLDNDGTVTIGNNTNSTVIVHNTYTPAPATVDLDVHLTKDFQVESALALAADFTFALQEWNGTTGKWEDMDTGTITYAAGENGQKTFDLIDIFKNIEYTAVGDYAYQIIEVIPEGTNKLHGVAYDRTVWTFSVHVIDNGVGQLVATVTDDGTPVGGTYNVTFTNIYHVAPASLEVRKEVDITSGSNEISNAGFLFAAYEANADWTLMDETADLSVRSDAIGEARFTATYNQVGTHYFVVKEVNEGKPGWTYDTTQYHVTVVITKEAGDNLVAAMTVEKVTDAGTEAVTGGTITFKNTYDPTEATVNLDAAVRKELTGRTLKDREFTIGVFPDGLASNTTIKDALLLGTNRADGTVKFDGVLTFDKVGTYRYDVAELINDMGGITYDTRIYDLVVEVTDNGSGALTATYYYEDVTGPTATFTNRYTATQTTYTVTGNKTLTGKALINDEFTFIMEEVADANGSALPGAQSWTTTNAIDGTITFPAITYATAGVHYYKVTEKQEATTGGITFDNATYIVTVTVTDNGVGQLVASGAVNSPNGQILFTNHYVPAKTSGTLAGDKVLEGKVLGAGAYQFQLHSSNAAWDDLGVLGQPVPNGADGKFQFPEIEYTQAGTYYYLVTEVNGGQPINGVTYDDSVFRVQVTVTDDLKGQLHAETVVFDEYDIPQIGVQFVNVYAVTGDAGLVLSGSKDLTGRAMTDGEFTFELYETDDTYTVSGTPIKTATNAAGQFAIKLDYTAAQDLGKTYYYVLQEKNAGQTIAGVTYADTKHKITVKVEDDDVGGIKLTITTDGQQYNINKVTTVTGLDFTNTYNAKPTEVTITGTKELTGKALKADDFTFQLFPADSNYVATGSAIVTTNGANGKFQFPAQTLTTAGKHYFLIKEAEAGNTIEGTTYDNTVYQVQVTVTDNGLGELGVSGISYQKRIADGTPSTVGSIIFANTYDPADAYVDLIGSKTLEGKYLEEGMFTFELYATDSSFSTAGVTPTTTENTGYGLFSFNGLSFDTAGTYYYVLKEQNGGKTTDGITYAANEHRITVTVTDDGLGKLIPTVTADGIQVQLVGDTAIVTGLSFRNSYEAKPNTVSFSGTKTLTGIRPLKADDFTFLLYKTDSTFAITGLTPADAAKNGADGKFTFNDQTVDTAGNHYFVIKESNQSTIGGVAYDAAEYRITVPVTDDGKGQLQVGTATYQKVTAAGTTTENGIAFTNTYTTSDAHLTISGKKILEGRSLNANDSFVFRLQQTDDQFVALAGSAPQDKVNGTDGTFAFDQLTFTAPGTYYYTVKEAEAGNTIEGITYDRTVYEITVVVTDDENGKLIPTVSVDNSQATVNVTGTDAAVTDVTFRNVYAAAATDRVSLPGGKTVSGQWELKARQFAFQMFKADSRFVIQGSALQTVTNDENGNFSFDNITFNTPGSHYFVIKESSQNPINGMTYDDTVYHLSFDVADDLHGKLVITSASLDKITATTGESVTAMTFHNSYDAQDATLALSGKKVLEGKALLSGEFTFLLQQTDDKFVPWTGHGVIPSQAVNAGDGSFTFDAITYDTVGTYYYIVTEVDTGNERTTFDETVYKVTVTVTDENGVLKATAAYATENASAEEMVFTNVYTPKPADLPLTFTVNKTVKNIGKETIGPEGFTFVLEETEDAKIEAVTGKDGKATFDLMVSEGMIGETFQLKLYEKNDGKKNVTYSTAVYEITVAVRLGADNKLVADLTVNGKAAEQVDVAFENVYDYTVPATPYTGDNTSVVALFSLLGVSALALAAAVIFRKKFLA